MKEDFVHIEEDLRWICWKVKLRGREILKEHGVTAQLFQLLLHVKRFKGAPVGQIGQRMGIACSSLTDMMDRLESAGYISRTRDKVDRRQLNVEISKKGSELIDYVISARVNYIGEIMEQLKGEEIECVKSSLSLLRDLVAREHR